jgi:hypothetical protein
VRTPRGIGMCVRCGDGEKAPGQSRCRECANAYRRERYKKGGKAKSRKQSKTLAAKWSNYRASAARRGLDFTLTKDEFAELVTARVCHWCGRRPGGIDRYWNDEGYVDGNCVPCCGPCNIAKASMTPAKFVRMCSLVHRAWAGEPL